MHIGLGVSKGSGFCFAFVCLFNPCSTTGVTNAVVCATLSVGCGGGGGVL